MSKLEQTVEQALNVLQLIVAADTGGATPKQVAHARSLYSPTIKALSEALEELQNTKTVDLHSAIAGAIFDFAGFLSTRNTVIEVGATANASPLVELLGEWSELRGLNTENSAVENWQDALNDITEPPKSASEQEPVAWMYPQNEVSHLIFSDQRPVEEAHPHFQKAIPLYTAPQQKLQPFSDEELHKILHQCHYDTETNLRMRWLYVQEFVRAIYRAHGIENSNEKPLGN